jgi:hypothetical protein
MARLSASPEDGPFCPCAKCRSAKGAAELAATQIVPGDGLWTAAEVCAELHVNRETLVRLTYGDRATGCGRSWHLWLAREVRAHAVYYRKAGVARYLALERANDQRTPAQRRRGDEVRAARIATLDHHRATERRRGIA